ncbi:hypothetical protein ACFL0I_01850, partial [Gemmatimonadota bacterium]
MLGQGIDSLWAQPLDLHPSENIREALALKSQAHRIAIPYVMARVGQTIEEAEPFFVAPALGMLGGETANLGCQIIGCHGEGPFAQSSRRDTS